MKKTDCKNTAVLYFTLTASEEARVKQFTVSDTFSQNRSIAQKLINHTRGVLEEIDLPVITCSSENQNGDSFGERLANAFENLFEEGYENVIAVGNDSPLLNSSLINDAAEILKTEDLVLGPATDGGTYLIGMNRAVFDYSSFESLPWNSEKLYQVLSEQAGSSGTNVDIHELPRLEDIDSVADLHTFLTTAAPDRRIRMLIHQLFSIFNEIRSKSAESSLFSLEEIFYSNKFLRAPPLEG